MKSPKILLWDIETFPNEIFTWGIYQQDAIGIKKHWELASFAYKYLDDSKVHCVTRMDFTKDTTDKTLTHALYDVLESADILVAHNGDEFDFKKAKASFIRHGLDPISPKKTVDTKKLAKRYFNFTSNSLNHLAEYLGFGKKVQTGGFDLWLDCLKGVKSAWKKMAEYNKHDVTLLEKVYLKLRPWGDHPNLAAMSGRDLSCPRCGSDHLQSYGLRHENTYTYRRFRCVDCGGYTRSYEQDKTYKKPKYRSIA